MGKTVALRQGRTILDVPEENAQAAMAAGMTPVSDEELAKYDAKQSYEKEMGVMAGPVAFAQGATESVASIPGLFMGKSGGELLSEAATIGGDEGDTEIAKEALREGAARHPNMHLAGEVAGTVLGTKGMGMGVKAASQGTIALTTRLAPMLSPGGRALASGANRAAHLFGEVADEVSGAAKGWSPLSTTARTTARAIESGTQSVAMANEQAFIQNEALSADMGTAAFVMGALMPVGVLGLSKGAGKVADAAKGGVRQAARGFDKVFPPKATGGSLMNAPARGLESSLFGGAEGRAGGLAGLGDFLEEKAGDAFKAKMKMNTGYQFRIAGAVTGHLPLMATGLLADAAIEKYGPRALGLTLMNMAKISRTAAAHSAEAALGSTVGRTGAREALGQLVGGVPIALKAYGRQELNSLWDESRELVDGYSKDASRLATEIGTRYNDEAMTQPKFMQNVTVQSYNAINHLRTHMPPFTQVNPMQPALGLTTPAPADLERFQRHYRAALNPWTLYSDLAHGTVTQEAVETVKALYPSLYMDLQMEAVNTLGSSKTPLTQRQRQTFETLFGSVGATDPSRDVQFMMRQQQYVAMGGQPHDQPGGGGGGKPGRDRGSPTLGQQMRSPVDQAMMNIGNSGS